MRSVGIQRFRKLVNQFAMSSAAESNDVYIVSAKRTPMGAFLGKLSSLTAPQLGTMSIQAALSASNVKISDVDEVFLGNVLSANLGQAPAKQASLAAGISDTVPCTTIHKVCASGMKALAFGAQSIQLGQNNVVVCGGFESMSNTPYYVPNYRTGNKMGNVNMVDGMIADGLWDPYDNMHMGNCGEHCAETYQISKEEQDNYAVASFERALKAMDSGAFANEYCTVEIPQRKGEPVKVVEDESPRTYRGADKVKALKPAFKKDGGTVTAANASLLSDGSAALVLCSKNYCELNGLKPLGRILGYADAARKPKEFTVAPADAMPIALKRSGLSLDQIDYFEINEAFSVVALANMKILNIPHEKVNVNGGAVSLGHPLGCSGARIVTTLLNILQTRDGKFGCAGICNGGGGASAMVIERL